MLFPRHAMKHPTLKFYPCQEPLKRKSKKASRTSGISAGGAAWSGSMFPPASSHAWYLGLYLGMVFHGLNSLSECIWDIWGGFYGYRRFHIHGLTNHSSLLVCLQTLPNPKDPSRAPDEPMRDDPDHRDSGCSNPKNVGKHIFNVPLKNFDKSLLHTVLHVF